MTSTYEGLTAADWQKIINAITQDWGAQASTTANVIKRRSAAPQFNNIPGYSSTVPQNPPGSNRAAYNMVFSAANYGTYEAICTQIQYGPDIVGDQDSAAFIQAYYPHAIYYDQFSVGLVFTAVQDRKNFYDWMLNYTIVAAQHVGHIQGMRVRGPYGFDFHGVPEGGFVQSTTPADVVWPMTINFVGGYPYTRPKWLPGGVAVGNNSSTAFVPPHLDANQLPFYPNDYYYGAPQQGNYVPQKGNGYGLQGGTNPSTTTVQRAIGGGRYLKS